MTDTFRSQSQTKAAPPRAKERQAEKAIPRPEARSKGEPIALPHTVTAIATKKAPGLQMEEAVVTAGRAGENNITIEKFWVEVDGHLPAGFNVRTVEGHGLEALLEQRSYRRTYTGTGLIETGLTPIAPIGTKGRILVTDTTTGETLEQPWTWRVHRWGLSGLWQFIKGLFWKG